MDVVNSFSMGGSNYKDENIKVVLNKLIITESEDEIANDILQRVLDNSFHTIRFSFDDGYPNELNVSVYKSEEDIKDGQMFFSFSYRQIDGEIGEYDISQSDHMELKIHD